MPSRNKKYDLLKTVGFNAYQINSESKTIKGYSRKDFFKISIITGDLDIKYLDRSILIGGSTLFFSTSHIPYSCNIVSDNYNGFACLFTEEFLKTHNISESLLHSPLFKLGGNPIFHLDDNQTSFISDIFKRMIDEFNTNYIFKDELIRNYINLLLHEALKMQPSNNFVKHGNASSRVTSVFLELLEKQFPIDDTLYTLSLKSANDYARVLNIHVNHLNHAVKKTTGKTTTTHITERIITEAKALLKYTDWSVSEIAYSLGFEYITYFNNYFKKITGITPTAYKNK